MKEEYVLKIIDKLHACDDLSLLDLIATLLDKSVK